MGRITWQQFRDIHSSLLNDLRVPAKIAQEQLGHASISTTLNIYTHVVDASHRRAVEDVERRLFGDVAPNGPKFEGILETAKPVSDKCELILELEAPPGCEPGMEVLQLGRGPDPIIKNCSILERNHGFGIFRYRH